MEGFYKYQDNELLYAPNAVFLPAGMEYPDLQATMHETYTYPIDGWTWFNSQADAEAALLP